MLNKV